MMKNISLFILLLLNVNASAQNITVFDRDTNQPIPFATAIFITNGLETSATYADDNGVLKLPENGPYDYIKLISLGYDDKIITKENLIATIPMNSKPVMLEEVSINFTRKLKDTIIGEYTVKRDLKFPLAVQNQIAVYFENPFNDEVPLKELRLNVHKAKYKTAVRVHFFCRRDYVQKLYIPNDPDKKYVPHDSFIPGDEITRSDIIAYIMPGDKELKVDLPNYDIVLPYDGIFAGIECLGYFDEMGESIIIENKHLTQLEFHQTKSDNYCVKIKLGGTFWKNENRHLKADTYLMGITLDTDQFQAPTMALVVSKPPE